MQKQSKQAAIFSLTLTPIVFWFGARVGSLITTKNLFDGLSSAFNGVWTDIAASPIVFEPSYYSFTIGTIFVLALWLAWLALFGMPKPEMVGYEHGSAHWATLKEMQKFKNLKSKKDNLVFSNNTGLATKREGFSLKYDRNLNVAVIGGSGSGKTRYYVKPNLMQCHGNYFVTDPKGTVIEDCSEMLERAGYEIKSFNVIPDTMHKSQSYNPLYYVKTKEQLLAFVSCLIKNTTPKKSNSGDPFWEKSEQLLYVAVLSMMQDWMDKEEFTLPNLLHYIGLAQAKEDDEDYMSPLDIIFEEIETGYMYVDSNGPEAIAYGKITGQINSEGNSKANDDFIQEELPQIIHGDDGSDISIKGAEYSHKTLKLREGKIAVPSDIVDKSIGKSPWEIFVESDGADLPSSRDEDFAVLRYKEFKAAAGKTLKSIIISCNTRLMPVAIPSVAKILNGKCIQKLMIDEKSGKKKVVNIPTGECEMELDRLGDSERKLALFAVMSDTNDTYFFLVALMMYQVVDLLCNKALADYGGSLPQFVHFIFDEFANLGVLKDFERTIAITRSRNIGISLILQTPFQLKANYEENAAKTILDNCDTLVYLGGGNDGADTSTCKEISARLGKQTIHTRGYNVTKGSHGSTSQNNGVQQRDLLMPDEVARLPRDEELVIIKNTFPCKDKKFVYK